MSETRGPRVLRRSPGRLRVQVPAIFDDGQRLKQLARAAGVLAVTPSERTGNVLIEFDESQIGEAALLTLIADQPPQRSRQRPQSQSGWLSGERSETLAAAPKACLTAVVEFERYPEWQAYVESVAVLERDRRGRGIRVLTLGRVGEREIQFTTIYSFPTPNRVVFEQEDGELAGVRGSWAFRSVGRGRTRARYELQVKPGWRLGLMLRGPLLDEARTAVLDHVMSELRERVELTPRRAAPAANAA